MRNNFLKMIGSCLIVSIMSCAELQQVVDTLPQSTSVISEGDIAAGLKEAFNKGIDEQVSLLTQKDGFLSNELVKIVFPEELTKVENTLRDIGLGSLADEGVKLLNRAAEDAVKEATPIFVNAIKEMTFDDAKNILLGTDDAATTYLIAKTESQLYDKFEPVVQSSLSKVGADQVWNKLINKYNTIPLVNDVNPDLVNYVTDEALEGVYAMIAIEEKEIRTNINSRTTSLLKRVFAMQD